jgi:hypothetical protein
LRALLDTASTRNPLKADIPGQTDHRRRTVHVDRVTLGRSVTKPPARGISIRSAHTAVTVVPVPRTAFTLAAGMLFGPVLGVAIAVVASTASAMIAMLLVRAAGWQMNRLVRHRSIDTEGTGLAELWDTIERHRQVLTGAGELDERRRAQQVDWTWQMVRDTVLDRVLSNPNVRKIRAYVERQVKAGELTPALAAQQILNAASR